MRKLAVFARWPEPGRVKTRLSPALPATMACDLYRAMLEDALAAASAAVVDARYIYWAEAPGEGSTGSSAGQAPLGSPAPLLVPAGFESRIQRGADLGERLEHAFAEMLLGPADRAVVIGADCPSLDAIAIDRAFTTLDARDAVLGPTSDGGYYLVALARTAPELFRGVPWSTQRVLEETVARARQAGISLALLPPLADIDTPGDLVRWIADAAGSETPAAPRTIAALRAIGLWPG